MNDFDLGALIKDHRKKAGLTQLELANLAGVGKTTVFDILFYVSFFISIVISITMEKKQLLYTLPIVIIAIILKYINVTKKEANPVFVFALLVALVSNIVSLYNFADYFIWATITKSIYYICCTIILKAYLSKGKLKSVLSLSVLLGFLLVSYIIYAVLDLLIAHLPDNTLFFTLLCAFCLVVYSIVFAMIYINDNYDNATILLASGVFSIFQTVLVPINEFFL